MISCAILAFVAPSAGLGAFPGNNGRIAYVGRAPMATYSETFTVFPNGSGLQQLTDNAVSEGEPSWSADGERLTYIRGVPGAPGGYQVFRMRANGGNQTRVTHDNGIDSSPGFSPNGRRIVYSRDNLPIAGGDTPRRVLIFTIRADGTDKRRIVGNFADSPEYSPNGRRIVFYRWPHLRRKAGIWTIRPDGSQLRRLTAPRNSGKYDQSPSWSPDGKHIVFLRCDSNSIHGCEGDVYVMRANGSYKHPVQAISGNISPTYSPAGNRIALSASGENCSDIYTIRSWGGDPRAVTHNCNDPEGGSAVQPSWQPLTGG